MAFPKEWTGSAFRREKGFRVQLLWTSSLRLNA
jgi:hypothetical protein